MANGYDASAERSQAFNDFADRNRGKAYGPEFHDSLIQTMRIPDGKICRDEQAWAWVRWRTWCNSSETAMSSWHSSGWELDQVDCALDLHWFQSGKDVRWIDSRTKEERKIARSLPEVKKRRSSISRAFQVVEARGQIDLSRGRIYAVVSPTFGPQVVEKLDLLSASREQLSKNPDFVEYVTLSGAGDLLVKVKEAKTALNAARKLLRPWEKQFRASGSKARRNLIDVKGNKRNSGGGGVVRSAVEEPPPPDPPPLTPEQETGAVVQGYLCRMKPGEDVEWPDDRILLAIHAVRLKAQKTVQDLAVLLDDLWRRGRKPRGYAWIRTVIADEWGVEDA